MQAVAQHEYAPAPLGPQPLSIARPAAETGGLEFLAIKSGEEWTRTEYQQSDGRVRIYEQFTGEFARQYRDLKTHYSTGTLLAYRRAEAALRKREMHQTEIVLVSRSYTKDMVGRARTASFSPQQASESDGLVEVILIAWDDGDDATWEGILYAEDFETGGWYTGAMQVDVQSAATAEMDWYDHGGDEEEEGEGGGPIEVVYQGNQPTLPQAVLVRMSPEIEFPESLLFAQHPNQENGRRASRDFLECFFEKILGCGVSCWWGAGLGGAMFFVCAFVCTPSTSILHCIAWQALKRGFWDWWDGV